MANRFVQVREKRNNWTKRTPMPMTITIYLYINRFLRTTYGSKDQIGATEDSAKVGLLGILYPGRSPSPSSPGTKSEAKTKKVGRAVVVASLAC